VEQIQATIAPVVTLYVNDFNRPARATYSRVGFTQIGSFATVLM
jgi:predicted GNAT family acetyltransferase